LEPHWILHDSQEWRARLNHLQWCEISLLLGTFWHWLVQHQHRLVESYTHFIQHGLVLEQQLLYGEASGKMQCFLMNMECITSFTDNCSPANLTTGFIKEHVFWNKLESI
jgi:hypothetical protein